MNLIFIWSETQNIKKNNGLCLSGKYEIEYKNDCLTIKKNNEYVDGFWGNVVEDCFAIVGDNGAGKTTLVNEIRCSIYNAKVINTEEKGIYIFEEEKKLLIYAANLGEEELKEIYNEDKKICDYKRESTDENIVIYNYKKNENLHMGELFEKYELVYFHNNFTKIDYCNIHKCKYDYSIGKEIFKISKDRYENRLSDIRENEVLEYFNHNYFQIIDFLMNYNGDIPFINKKVIEIDVCNMSKRNYNIKKIKDNSENKSQIEEMVKKVEVKYSDNWDKYTVLNILLNCYKRLCKPANHKMHKALKLSEKMFFSSFNKAMGECSKKESVYDFLRHMVIEIKKSVQYGSSDDKKEYLDEGYLSKVVELVDVIQKCNIFEKEAEPEKKIIILNTTEKKKNIKKFIEAYKAIIEANFPFFDFYFGVSTGEYCYLQIFSKLFSVLKSSSEENLLLIFDEVDLALHPKLQRQYMKKLIEFLEEVSENIKIKLKIIVTTHSPIILSDFPHTNVLYLKNEDKEKGAIEFYKEKDVLTFGSNIHSLFLNSFFLASEGTMGAFAEEKINRIIEELYEKDEKNVENNRKIVGFIGEGIIRNKLEIMLHSVSQNHNSNSNNETLLQELKKIELLLKNDICNRKVLESKIEGLKKYLDDKNKTEL